MPRCYRERGCSFRRRLVAPALEALETRRLMAFGVTNGTAATGQPTYVVDNGGDLKFSVVKGGSITSTLHLGDISSIQYKGQEMLATYAQTSRYSHYEQGLGSTTVITTSVDSTNGIIVVKCDDSSSASRRHPVLHSPPERQQHLHGLAADGCHAGAGRGTLYRVPQQVGLHEHRESFGH